jgi:ATP-dependent DNA helicase RecQ
MNIPLHCIRQAAYKAANIIGYTSIREEQEEAVVEFVRGKDVFISLPTGSGKSLCYILLPLVFDQLRPSPHHCIIIVVSPLHSLMEDQVRKLSKKGIKCTYVVNYQSQVIKGQILNGAFQLVFMSPEVLLRELTFREMLRSKVYTENLIGVAIDEAHCVEKWGTEFRTEFDNISEIRSLVPKNTRFMALTATATIKTRDVILSSLNMAKCHLIIQPPDKHNIKYYIFKQDDIDIMLQPIIDEVQLKGTNADRTIIFCRTYVDTLNVFKTLVCKLGRRNMLYSTNQVVNKHYYRICEKYDGSTSTNNQNHIIESFTQDDGVIRIIVATIAFGMGLDSPNVRKIIHWGAPFELEMYVQETGRGGRDGQLCEAILYYKRPPGPQSNMHEYCTNSTSCRRQLLMSHFSTATSFPISSINPMHNCCDVCESHCSCDKCHPILFMDEVQLELVEDSISVASSFDFTAPIPQAMKKTFRLKLHEYRASLIESPIPSLMIGAELLTGLSDELIEEIIENSQQITAITDLMEMGVYSHDMSIHIFQLIQTILH